MPPRRQREYYSYTQTGSMPPPQQGLLPTPQTGFYHNPQYLFFIAQQQQVHYPAYTDPMYTPPMPYNSGNFQPAVMVGTQNTPSASFSIDDFYQQAKELCLLSRQSIHYRRSSANTLIEKLLGAISSQTESTLTSKNIANIVFMIGKLASNNLLTDSIKSKLEFIENLLNRMSNTIAHSDRPTQHIANLVYGLGLLKKSEVITQTDNIKYRAQLKKALNAYLRSRVSPDDSEDEYTYLDQAIKAAYDEFKKEAEGPMETNLFFFNNTVDVNQPEAKKNQNSANL